ncbi:Emopamil-binding protein [Phellopilus nigrolimitatus]|nr:Emopamil-binding protein [Phellopilus nigrolimitatus]
MTLETSEPPCAFHGDFCIFAVATIGLVARTAAKALLPKSASWQDKFTFVWLVCSVDTLIQLVNERSWLYLSTFGRTVNASEGPFAELWKEYTLADFRWGVADPTIVSLELLTVLGAGPLCCYILYQLVRNDPARHYWIIVVSTAELYGGFITFGPEWLTGCVNLDTSNALYFWVYLIVRVDVVRVWVIIPLGLMYDSYSHIAGSLRLAQSNALASKRR